MKTKKAIIIAMTATLLFAACNHETDISKGENVVYEENFDGNSGWMYLKDEANYIVSEAGGKLIQKRTESDGNYYYAYAKKQFTGNEKKQILEFTFRLTAGTGSVVVVLNADKIKETSFYLTENHYFKINRYNATTNTLKEITEWTESSLINITQTSILRIELENGIVNFIMNGKKLYQWNDSDITNLDYFGLGLTMWENSSPSTLELDKVCAFEINK
ncbi:MAG: hypothetical protein GX102_06845 [Porphyromonadaceae bacterium]|nr:hypothetical protein [Porphyromonadaceae bacterium]